MPPILQVSPIDSYIDEEIRIKVKDCSVDSEVTLQAVTHDESGKKFCSYATFIANEEGVVDPSLQKPICGTYGAVDGSGLFWSMKQADSKWDDYYEKRTTEKVRIVLTVIVNGEKLDSESITRYFYSDDVKKVEIEFDEVKGTLFRPAEEGRYPAVIILSGSDGGMQEHAAALLASKGFVTFALAYFGTEGVPRDLENIPLEYFQRATVWLLEQPYVNGEVSLIGYSRGGELALLLGATFDYYKKIIAGAPSAYLTPGMKNGIFAPVKSWVVNQHPLPYVKLKYPFSTMFRMFKNWMLKQPISYLSIWDYTLKDEEENREASIPVEKIKARVLLIAGGDDQLWPSEHSVKMMEEKLRKAHCDSHQNRYLYYKDAGHFSAFPYSFVNLPANVYMKVGGGMTMTFGGSKSANAAAARDSWREIQEFLKER